MIILDSDHLTALQTPGQGAQALAARIRAANDPTVTTTIVNIEEALRGRLATIHRAGTTLQQIHEYSKLTQFLSLFRAWSILPFDAAAGQFYDQLQALHLRSIGSMDLKIAAIALAHNGLLLSANLRHFNLVPGLHVEDWIYSQNKDNTIN